MGQGMGHPPEAGLSERLRRLLREALSLSEGALGLGFTLPGVVVEGRLLLAPNLGWKDLDLTPPSGLPFRSSPRTTPRPVPSPRSSCTGKPTWPTWC